MARRSNQSILKEINPEYSLEGLMLKLQYFGHLIQRVNSLGKTLRWERLKAEGDGRGQDGWMASLTQWAHVWASSRRCEGQGSLACCSLWGRRVGHDRVTEQRVCQTQSPNFIPFYVPLPKNYFPFTNIQILPLLWSFSPNLQYCWHFHSTFDTTHSHLGFPGGSDGK